MMMDDPMTSSTSSQVYTKTES